MSAAVAAAPGERRAFLRRLFDEGLLLDTGMPGVFGRGPVFEALIRRLERMFDGPCGEQGAQRVFFPPLTPRETLQRTGFVANFPHLCGSVHAFGGDDEAHQRLLARVAAGADWGDCLEQTEAVLTPAACYPLYPTQTGTLPAAGRLFDLTAYCFRREPSDDPARLQAFQVRENVRLGSPEQVQAWRQGWSRRALELLRALGLPARLVPASDPFFGRGGRLMRASQRELELKLELVVPLWSDASPTAVASFNYHQAHFGQVFAIHLPDGSEAHSACLGFGLERIAMALLRVHGLDPARWAAPVRERLGP